MEFEDIVKQIIIHLDLKSIHSMFLATKQFSHLKNYRYIVQTNTAFITTSISNKHNGMIYQFYKSKLSGFGYKVDNKLHRVHVLHHKYRTQCKFDYGLVMVNTKKYEFDFTNSFVNYLSDDELEKYIDASALFETMMNEIYHQLIKMDPDIEHLMNMSKCHNDKQHIFFYPSTMQANHLNNLTFSLPKEFSNESKIDTHKKWLI